MRHKIAFALLGLAFLALSACCCIEGVDKPQPNQYETVSPPR